MDIVEKQISEHAGFAGYQTFYNHAQEILGLLRAMLRLFEETTRSELKRSYLKIVSIEIPELISLLKALELYNVCIQRRECRALQSLVSACASALGVSPPPIAYLGNDYYSYGSYTYTIREIRDKIKNNYYAICVREQDPPAYWCITLHEVAHCHLGQTKNPYIDKIVKEHTQDIKRSNIDVSTVEDRLTEALCDTIATLLIGEGYAYALLFELWPTPEAAAEYPKLEFRLKCCATALEKLGKTDQAEKLNTLMGALNVSSWRAEEISWALDDIVDAATQVVTKSADSCRKYASAFSEAWTKILDAPQNQFAGTVEEVSNLILKALEGGSGSPHTEA